MSDSLPSAPDSVTGYKRPPASTQFRKGRSGNPRGRPRGRHREVPYQTVLGQMVTIREDGRERRVTAAEAFILHLTRKGLAGDSAAARASLGAIEAARTARGEGDGHEPITVILVMIYSIGCAMKPLNIGVKRNRLDKEKVHWLLNPWIVEAALARFGDRRLNAEEQREVWRATRDPRSVKWPEWWTEQS